MKHVTYTLKDYLITGGILLAALFFLVLAIKDDANLLVKLIILAFFAEALYSLVDLLAWKLAFDDTHFVTRSLFQKETTVPYSDIISAEISSTYKKVNFAAIGQQNLVIFYRNRRLSIAMGMTNTAEFAAAIDRYMRAETEGHHEL